MLNRRGKKWDDSFFFFFFFGHFFEATEICLGCTKMEISTGKKSISRPEKLRKSAHPAKKYSSYASAFVTFTFCLFVCP